MDTFKFQCSACRDRMTVGSSHTLDTGRLRNALLCKPCGDCPAEVLGFDELVLAALGEGLTSEQRARRDGWVLSREYEAGFRFGMHCLLRINGGWHGTPVSLNDCYRPSRTWCERLSDQ